MSELIRTAPPLTGGRVRKSLALLGALLLVGVSLYASREVSPVPAPAVAAEEKEQKPAAPRARAVAAAAIRMTITGRRW